MQMFYPLLNFENNPKFWLVILETVIVQSVNWTVFLDVKEIIASKETYYLIQKIVQQYFLYLSKQSKMQMQVQQSLLK